MAQFDPDEKDLGIFFVRMLQDFFPFMSTEEELGILKRIPGTGRRAEE